MKTLLAAAALVLLVTWSPTARAQSCPANSYSEGSGGGFFQDSSTQPIHSFGGASYDLVAGTLSAGVTGFGEGGAYVSLQVQDLYTIVGPASATPIEFLARVRFTGTLGADLVTLPGAGTGCVGSFVNLGMASASLTDEAQLQSNPSPACGPRSFDETLDLALTKLPGQEFPLSVSVYASAGHTIQAQTSGQIVFVGLPPGYSMESCQGYAGSPVATRSSSWGRVKQLYR